MATRSALLVALCLTTAGCQVEGDQATEVSVPDGAAVMAQAASQGLVRLDIPAEDPGPPFYARVATQLNQFFHSDGWLAIPFYRDPACIPADFNLLGLFDFPGPGGPGAFACPLLMNGFLLTEPDAPLGTFPRQVVLTSDAAPFWFVPWTEFEAVAADGVVTIRDLERLAPLTGIADRYHETLRPREGDHAIIIQASGTLEDGRTFQFSVTHLQDRTRSVRVRFR